METALGEVPVKAAVIKKIPELLGCYWRGATPPTLVLLVAVWNRELIGCTVYFLHHKYDIFPTVFAPDLQRLGKKTQKCILNPNFIYLCFTSSIIKKHKDMLKTLTCVELVNKTY